MMGPPVNEQSRLAGGLAQSSELLLHEHDANSSKAQTACAKGSADELRRIAAALDARNADDCVVTRAADAVLAEYEKKNQFALQPSKSDFARIAAACGFSRDEITAAWASYQRSGKFAAIFAMSWQALKWAATQRAGSLSANAVLRVLADHADSKGKVWISAPQIAHELDTSKPTVLAAQKRLLESLMSDTKKRGGDTRRIPVFQLKMPKIREKRTRNGKETVKKRISNGKAALPLLDTRASARASSEPGTSRTKSSLSERELFCSPIKDEKKSIRPPACGRPKDADEVWEYIFTANEAQPLAKYFRELEGADGDDSEGDRDIEKWLLINGDRGWSGVTDWHVYLRKTFFDGWFPSQKRRAKKRLK